MEYTKYTQTEMLQLFFVCFLFVSCMYSSWWRAHVFFMHVAGGEAPPSHCQRGPSSPLVATGIRYGRRRVRALSLGVLLRSGDAASASEFRVGVSSRRVDDRCQEVHCHANQCDDVGGRHDGWVSRLALVQLPIGSSRCASERVSA